MSKRWKRWLQARNGSQGQGTLEFALVVVVFLMLVFGLVDLGRAVMLYNTVGTAAHSGARFGVVLNDPSWGTNPFQRDGSQPGTYVGIAPYLDSSFENTIVGRVARTFPALDPSQTTIVISGIGTNPQRGQELRVAVSHTFTPVAGGLLPIDPFTVAASSSMYVE